MRKQNNMLKDDLFKIIIPARKGSKRLPNKHFRKINGKFLYEFTFDYVSAYIEKKNIWVNTDDDSLISVAKEYGFNTCKRPSKYSNDLSPSIEFLKYQMDYFDKLKITFRSMALIQITSPFRPKNIITQAYSKYLSSGCESLASFSLIKKKIGNINRNKFFPINYNPDVAFQDCKDVYFENGLIYILGKEAIKKGKIITPETYTMIIESNHAHIDIDYEQDLKMAEAYLKLKLIDYDY